ncbi:hypothetical protein ACFL5U_03940 [Candidatus Margulisiibacteriota bacterium]
MNITHKDLANGKWQKLSLVEQLANIGSEVERTIKWQKKNTEYSERAFYRGLELLDLSIADPKNRHRLKELLRLREMLADYFIFDNGYSSTVEQWQKYFYSFNYAARLSLS